MEREEKTLVLRRFLKFETSGETCSKTEMRPTQPRSTRKEKWKGSRCGKMLARKLLGKIETLPEAAWRDFSNGFAPGGSGQIGLLDFIFWVQSIPKNRSTSGWNLRSCARGQFEFVPGRKLPTGAAPHWYKFQTRPGWRSPQTFLPPGRVRAWPARPAPPGHG